MDPADRIARLEAARAKAIVEADIAALSRITDDDYVHVEVSGQVRDKRGFLDGVPRGREFGGGHGEGGVGSGGGHLTLAEIIIYDPPGFMWLAFWGTKSEKKSF